MTTIFYEESFARSEIRSPSSDSNTNSRKTPDISYARYFCYQILIQINYPITSMNMCKSLIHS